ncbi:MAG TPA: prepilin-type N-terminal cleavage/methylation domain-containing protein [Bacillota bacterium]|nr:prepilin-type N-terminal cleavage/methylation domain-containing protein [Bacillota bacterium]
MKKNQGFTLVEVLASVTILFIIGTSFFQFFIHAQRETTESEMKLEALNIAQTVFERIEHGEYPMVKSIKAI